MAADHRISVAEAADFIGTPDAPRLIQLAWKLKIIQLRGVRPGESDPVEIPFSENGTVDCDASRIGEGALLTAYRNVTIAWANVRRLTQIDVKRLAKQAATTALPPPAQMSQSASKPKDIASAKAGPKVKAVAFELRGLFPQGRPPLQINELMRRVHKEAGDGLGVLRRRTFERAIALAWPLAKRQRGPKASKAPQT
jgi:hypothetical protein